MYLAAWDGSNPRKLVTTPGRAYWIRWAPDDRELRFNDLDANWRAIRKKVKLKKARKLGRVISAEEESALLRECRASRSRSLSIAVVLALETCMRYSEIRLLQWRQVDLTRQVVTVEETKTEAGSGREIPLTAEAHRVLTFWAAHFPHRKLSDYVFPAEQYGGRGKDKQFGFSSGCSYSTDPTRPMGNWKEAWEAAKRRAGVACRFHDLRHTACTRLLEAGVSHPVLAEIMGWSASTAIRMIKEVYGHVGLSARRRAMQQMEGFISAQKVAQKGAQSEEVEIARIQ